MHKDNMFYLKPKKAVGPDPDELPILERGSWEEVYDQFLLPKLLSTPPFNSYPKALVDFAELILEFPDAETDWFTSAGSYKVRSILGRSLELAAVTDEIREFSAGAMAFVGYKFELSSFAEGDPRGADAICHELIDYLGLVPEYFRRIEKGEMTFLKGTKKLRRETGLTVYLEYESVW